ncbi:MAG TPA: hypothetical protein VJ732_08495 [Bryobacteraceae bacterium]|nr:hypothetical protein [Bryobacteraceae bacterium]
MESPWLYRYAALLAVCTLFLVIAGAVVTSYAAGSSIPPSIEAAHLTLAAVVGLLTLGLAAWLTMADRRAWLKKLAWAAVAVVAVQALLGSKNPGVAVVHALLAQFFFALIVSLAVLVSPRWLRGPETVEDPGRPPMRALGIITIALLVLQVSMGAAVRHNLMSAIPHIIGALVVTIVILLLAFCVIHQYPEHASLRPAARILIGLTFAQVMLGMGAFIMRLMAAESSPGVMIPSVSHVATGSLTLATTTVLVIQILRNVQHAAVQRAGAGSTVAM